MHVAIFSRLFKCSQALGILVLFQNLVALTQNEIDAIVDQIPRGVANRMASCFTISKPNVVIRLFL